MSTIGILSNEPWVERLGWALIHSLWQEALIAGIYVVARIGASQSKTRYLMACTALLTMTLAPLATFIVGTPVYSAATNYLAATNSEGPIASFAARDQWSTTPILSAAPVSSLWLEALMPSLVVVWFAGVSVFWLRLASGWLYAARLRSVSVREAPPEWQRTLRDLSVRIHVPRPVRFLISPRVAVPAAVGWLRPVVLMPIGALTGLPVEHIKALLAHELAHVRRHDYIVNLLQMISEVMLFYHPAVWWISSQIRQEREHCCDDLAVSVTGDAVVYAQALLETCRVACFSVAVAATGGSLKSRIAQVLGMQSRDRRLTCTSALGALASLLFFAGFFLLAQQTPATPTFDVASINLTPPDYVGFQSYVRGDRYTASAATVRDLMTYAYGILSFQISGGPAWASSEHYNISAKMSDSVVTDQSMRGMQPPAVAPTPQTDQSRLMLQSLLAERFGMKFHRATKNRSGYALVVDKNGPKLKLRTKPGVGLGISSGHLNGIGADMRSLTQALSSQLEVPIANRTGLSGIYNFTLTWTPDPQQGGQADDSSGLSVFTAIQEQLGLRLEPVKNVPVDLFVIDHVHKPSAN